MSSYSISGIQVNQPAIAVGNNSPQNPKIFYYVDRRGAVQRDTNTGYLGCVIRSVTSLWRDYNLFHVSRAMFQGERLQTDVSSFISNKLAKKCRITDTQYQALKSGDLIYNNNEFLSEIRNNKTFNASIKKLIDNGGKLEGVSDQVLQDLSAFSYKTTMEEKLVQVSKKAQVVLEKFTNRIPIADADKLTLQEVRSLESVANMKPLFDKIPVREGEAVDKLREASNLSSNFIEKMLTQAESEITFKSGTYIIYNLKNDYALRGQKISWIQDFVYKYILRSNINHIAVGYKEGGKDMEAHMWGSPVSIFKKARRTLGNRCFKTIQLEPLTMVNENDSIKMQALYGEDWRELLLDKYSEVSRNYFNNTQELSQLVNPSLRRVIAAIGFRFTIFYKSWEERCEFSPSKEVICSEFSVLSSMQCLKKLNSRIKDDWNASLPGGFSEDLSAPRFDPPIRENRRLNRVIPQEIIHRLVNEGCASVEDVASCIRATIKFDDEDPVF